MFDNILPFKPRNKDGYNKIPKELTGFHVAILATDGFEQSELFEPKDALDEAGALVEVISIQSGRIKSWNHTDWGKSINVTRTVDEVSAAEFDALLLPGGVINPDHLRMSEDAVLFVKDFLKSKKPVAAICHGPQVLIETKLLKGKKLTSWRSIKTDLMNAGAKWVDEEVVVDNYLITSRKPSDIPVFNRVLIKEFVKSRFKSNLPDVEGFSATR